MKTPSTKILLTFLIAAAIPLIAIEGVWKNKNILSQSHGILLFVAGL